MVLWAPFHLLLVGGQDRITSFAMEDNEFWLRHLIRVILQVFTTSFVFIQSLYQNRLWIPTLLLLLAGTIKYAERTIAMYLASMNCFGISLLTKPDPGPNYEKLMTAYSTFKDMGVSTQFECLEHNEFQVGKLESPTLEEDHELDNRELDNRDLVEYGYGMANKYKGLIVNLMFSSCEHKESRDLFSKIDAEDTLRILEIELNFFYDLLHTKVVVATSKVGIISQCTSLGLVVAALSLFYKEEKQGFHRFDVKVNYTLFFGVLGLNVVTLLQWVFSDWAIVSLKKYEKNFLLSKIFDKFLDLKKPRWKQSADSSKQSERKTPIIFRRWSETLSQFNYIEYCWEQRSGGMYEVESRNIITSILKYFHIKDFINQMKNAIFQATSVSSRPLTKNLWEFIFKELNQKSKDADDPEVAKRIGSARGEWVLENCDFIDCSKLMPFVKDVAYDESLPLWHIATELCYNTDEHSHSGPTDICHYCDYCDACDFSKYLSDYMIYLLYQQPSLMSEVSGIAKQRFRDTWAESQRFFSQRDLKKLEDIHRRIIGVETELKPVQVKGNRSKSVLFDASMLAKELKELGNYWKVTSKVWVELMSYAASRGRGNAHVQQLSKGGELLTFVWLLMAQFGLREAWVETRFSTRLIVGK